MKISIRLVSVTASVLALATLTACVAPAPVYQTSRYPYQPVQPMAQSPYVEYGHVANIEVLRSQTSGTGTSGGGAVAGGVLGGVVGNQFGHGSGRAAATALGVVGGALLGNSIEANRNAPRVYEAIASRSRPTTAPTAPSTCRAPATCASAIACASTAARSRGCIPHAVASSAAGRCPAPWAAP